MDTGCQFLKTSWTNNKLGENDGSSVMLMYHDLPLFSLFVAVANELMILNTLGKKPVFD